jgi:hypothetical protein
MKVQLLISLALVVLPVQAKIEQDRFVFSDWQMLSNDVILLPNPPRHPAQLSESDLGAVLVCRTGSGQLIQERVVTSELLYAAIERGMFLFCTKGRASFWYTQ